MLNEEVTASVDPPTHTHTYRVLPAGGQCRPRLPLNASCSPCTGHPRYLESCREHYLCRESQTQLTKGR